MSKKWSLHPSLKLALILVVPYMCSTWLWLPAIRNSQKLAITGIAWSVMTAIMTVILGVCLFREHLSVENYIGLILAGAALVLLN